MSDVMVEHANTHCGIVWSHFIIMTVLCHLFHQFKTSWLAAYWSSKLKVVCIYCKILC